MAILDEVVIAAPCPISWDNMNGDDRVRHCSGCNKNVYNIADMTDAEANAFFEKNGSTECIRIFRRSDGKMMTDNCPKGLRLVRNRIMTGIKLGAGIAAAIFAFIPGKANAQQDNPQSPEQSKPQHQELRGDVYIPPSGTVETKGNVAMPNVRKNPKIMLGGECTSDGTRGAKENTHAVMGKIAPNRFIDTNSNPKPKPMPPAPILVAPPAQQPAQKKGASVQFAAPNAKEQAGAAAPLNKESKKEKTKADSRAYDIFKLAQDNEAKGNHFLALLQYQEAVIAAKQQYQGDPNFLNLTNRSLNNLKNKMMG